MQRHLGYLVAGVEATRLAPDEVAVAVEEAQLGGLHPEGAHLVEQAERRQRRHGVGEQVDADAERPDLARRLVDLDLDALGIERQSGRQPADARSCDDDSHDRPSAAPRDPRALRRTS